MNNDYPIHISIAELLCLPWGIRDKIIHRQSPELAARIRPLVEADLAEALRRLREAEFDEDYA